MEKKDLTGYRFTDSRGVSGTIIAGCEATEAVSEEKGSGLLHFCCGAKVVDGILRGAYHVCYTVTKEEFFADIEGLNKEEKKNADTIAAALREKYYKIPTVFLRLVGEGYLKGER